VRVLMVLCDMRAGGAEKTALELVRTLNGRDCEFIIASIRRGGALAGAFAGAATRLYLGVSKWRFDLLAPLRIARIIRRERIGVVIVVDVPRNALFCALAGSVLSFAAPRRICWCKSPPGGQSGRFIGWLRMFRAMRLLDAIVCTSRRQRSELEAGGLPRRRMPLIRNGVNLRRRVAPPRPAGLSLPAGKKLIVQIANVMPDKDHATLLKAASRLAEMRDDFHVLLVGRDTDSQEMARAVQRRRLEEVVTLAGHCDDISAVLALADIFVLSTKNEAFSVATLEALAAGLPVVVSDIPAFDEMFSDGQEGLKVPPGDGEALCEALAGLLDDEAGRTRMGDAARRRAMCFGLSRMARNFRRLLRCIAKRP